MRIGIATDHGEFGLKKLVVKLKAAGDEVMDFGARILTLDNDKLILSFR